MCACKSLGNPIEIAARSSSLLAFFASSDDVEYQPEGTDLGQPVPAGQ
jgi:hypothetical protein